MEASVFKESWLSTFECRQRKGKEPPENNRATGCVIISPYSWVYIFFSFDARIFLEWKRYKIIFRQYSFLYFSILCFECVAFNLSLVLLLWFIENSKKRKNTCCCINIFFWDIVNSFPFLLNFIVFPEKRKLKLFSCIGNILFLLFIHKKYTKILSVKK